MKYRIVPISLTLSLLLISCSSEMGDPLHQFNVETIDGVVTAINNGIPKFPEDLFSYEEVLRFSEDPENEASLLYRPRQILQDREGDIYIVDSGNSRIAVFDNNGIYVRSIGRSGEGPGEFLTLDSPLIHDGRVQVYDRRLNRLSIFTTNGELQEMIPLASLMSEHQIRTPMLVYRYQDGSLLINDDQLTSDEEKQLSTERVFLFDSDGVLQWQTGTPGMQIGTWVVFRGVRGLGAIMPFASRPAVGFDPDQGILVSPADEPVLLLYHLNGSLKLRIEIQLEEKAFTSEDRTTIMDDWDERIRNASGPSLEQLQSMRDGMTFPDRWPYWGTVNIDDAGFMWLAMVEHQADREAAGSRTLFKVISPEGEYLGNTRVPRASGPTRYGHRAARITDPDTGEVTMVVYRIVSAVEGFRYPLE